MLFVETTADPSSFMENDKVIITLPFPASRINRDKTSIKNDAWEDQFWFKPMKTQLAIAADIVATNGGTAVAEASGISDRKIRTMIKNTCREEL